MFAEFGIILFELYCGQTDRHTQRDADERFTPAIDVGVSNYGN